MGAARIRHSGGAHRVVLIQDDTPDANTKLLRYTTIGDITPCPVCWMVAEPSGLLACLTGQFNCRSRMVLLKFLAGCLG